MLSDMAARSSRAKRIAEWAVKLEDVLGCEVVDNQGQVLARANRGLNLPSDWKEIDGVLPGVVWGVVARAESSFGKAELVVVDYENTRIVGFTLFQGEFGLVVAVLKSSDPYSLKKAFESFNSSS